MKCKYRFKIEGRIRLDRSFTVPLEGRAFEFVLINGILDAIDVIFPLLREDWPRIGPSIFDPATLLIEPKLPHLEVAKATSGRSKHSFHYTAFVRLTSITRTSNGFQNQKRSATSLRSSHLVAPLSYYGTMNFLSCHSSWLHVPYWLWNGRGI